MGFIQLLVLAGKSSVLPSTAVVLLSMGMISPKRLSLGSPVLDRPLQICTIDGINARHSLKWMRLTNLTSRCLHVCYADFNGLWTEPRVRWNHLASFARSRAMFWPWTNSESHGLQISCGRAADVTRFHYGDYVSNDKRHSSAACIARCKLSLASKVQRGCYALNATGAHICAHTCAANVLSANLKFPGDLSRVHPLHGLYTPNGENEYRFKIRI